MSDSDSEKLPSSDLGKKEYWDSFYAVELENFDEFGEEGEIWFGKCNVNRIIKWLDENQIKKSSAILDVGCGNGYTLMCLAKNGYDNLFGVDYSDEAILLAKKISSKKGFTLNLQALDFLSPVTDEKFKSFHVIIDKGTYDAICLDRENLHAKRQKYISQIQNLLSPEGYFLIFSCNWTKEELLQHFKDLKFHIEIEIPSISFGGKKGQTVTALVFQKNIER